MDVSRLPELGVGVSLSFGVPPEPNTLVQRDGGPDFIEYAGAVDVGMYYKDIKLLHSKGIPTLFHPSCMNLCGPWPNPPSWLQAIKDHVEVVSSPWLAQDVSICFVDEPGYSIQLGYFIGPILSQASLDQAVQRVLEVRAVIDRPLLLEPPPATWKVGDMSMMKWLNRLAQRTDCGLLIDAGHLYAHCLVEKKNLLSDIAFARVVEVHVAGGSIKKIGRRKYYKDDHTLAIQPEVWAVFDKVVQQSPNLKAVCYECEGAVAGSVIPVLEQLKNRVLRNTVNASLRDKIISSKQQIPEKVTVPLSTQSETTRIKAGYRGVLRLLFDAEQRKQ